MEFLSRIINSRENTKINNSIKKITAELAKKDIAKKVIKDFERNVVYNSGDYRITFLQTPRILFDNEISRCY